jgi:hypothetical protein
MSLLGVLKGYYESDPGSPAIAWFHLHLAAKITQALPNTEEPKAAVTF